MTLMVEDALRLVALGHEEVCIRSPEDHRIFGIHFESLLRHSLEPVPGAFVIRGGLCDRDTPRKFCLENKHCYRAAVRRSIMEFRGADIVREGIGLFGADPVYKICQAGDPFRY